MIYYYYGSASLTNRKRRSTKVYFNVDQDCDFRVDALRVGAIVPVRIRLFNDEDTPVSGPIMLHGRIRIDPSVLYRAGRQLSVEVGLLNDVHVGRTRPRIELVIEGYKIHRAETPVQRETKKASQ